VNGIIYGLIDGDTLELRYIGQTTNSHRRFSQHRRAWNLKSHRDNWLRATNWNMIVLERDPPDLNEAEIRWIKGMREQGARLLNVTDGGNGGGTPAGWHHSPETCARLSVLGMGRSVDAKTRIAISAAHKGKPRSIETCTKISTGMMGNQNGIGNSGSRGRIPWNKRG